ncbi:aminotransferase [Cantharellus anzutake]|uniref:aminotransferase n=1 Tax=Cantharellus anzutake TaxID=1750568 RepID=UPI0019057FFE|nr:aminotransferase [Cantharellus anzutake]KAF8342176.1 aminotransferase [Cantharellus anzutake]
MAAYPTHFRDVVEQLLQNLRSEKDSEAHRIFRSHPGHKSKHIIPETVNPNEETVPGVQHPGSTGVIYCTDRAMANGFTYGDPQWANLGQGAPEVGEIPDAPPRITSFQIPVEALEYGPTTGVKAFRQAVANLYNIQYRQGKESKYTYENVCIVPGGRAGMSRVAAVVGDVYCGYQVPEYTTYSEVLSVFKRLVPVPTALKPENEYRIDVEQLKGDIRTQGLQVIVASNPRNPTGQVIRGEDLKALIKVCIPHTTLVLDEFYSWYIYPKEGEDYGQSVSGAAFVEDVNEDPVVLIDGLTKNFRLPGWRTCWVIGPKNLISALSQSGSFLDGGANHPLQIAGLPLLDPDRVIQEKLALQKHFHKKRDHVLKRLAEIGLPVKVIPHATFYIWLDLSSLPHPLDDGLTFFEELLREKTIVIPGIFFEINPAHRRDLFASPCHHFIRISFGPPLSELDKGLDAIARVLERVRREGAKDFGHSYKHSGGESAVHQ